MARGKAGPRASTLECRIWLRRHIKGVRGGPGRVLPGGLCVPGEAAGALGRCSASWWKGAQGWRRGKQ